MECDNLIIGAGLVGSSVAMGLGSLGQGPGTVVVDLDLEGTFSSSELNAGGVRQLWGRSINVACARASIEYFSKLGVSTKCASYSSLACVKK
jgi:glycine/D-amino acid oxidase-like deaminating enzyme